MTYVMNFLFYTVLGLVLMGGRNRPVQLNDEIFRARINPPRQYGRGTEIVGQSVRIGDCHLRCLEQQRQFA